MSDGFSRNARRILPPARGIRGFSLVELIVVAAIILVVTAVVFTSNSSFSRTLMVTNTAYDIALSLRNAQTYGLGTRAVSGISNAGYGIHFDRSSPSRYFMFNDSYPVPAGKVGVSGICQPIPGTPQDPSRPDAYAGDCMYTSGSDSIITSYTLGNAMRILDICAYGSGWTCTAGGVSWLDIVFTRPNGTAVMNAYINNTAVPVSTACITIASPQGTERYVTFRANGQIFASDTSCPNVSITSPGGAPTPATCSLVPAFQTIASGSSAALGWSTTNANAFSVDNGVGVLNPAAGGTTQVSPTVNTTYVGTASGSGGPGTCVATVNMSGMSGSKVIFLTSGTSWTVPSDWNSSSNSIEAIGEGGNGEPLSSGSYSYGGGGGAYAAIFNLNLAPGAFIPIQIGTGGQGKTTQFRDSTTLVADYGRSGTLTAPGVGGAVANSVGMIKYAGGNAVGVAQTGGSGGGGAAGPSGRGGDGGWNCNDSGYGGSPICSSTAGRAGAGGGAANGGSNGANSNDYNADGIADGGTGGGGTRGGTGGGGTGGTSPVGNAGTGGVGGGGSGEATSDVSAVGSAGGASALWAQTSNGALAGPGGGGGGGAYSPVSARSQGGVGGLYGGGGGGGGGPGAHPSDGGPGAPGIIVITYTPISGGGGSAATCSLTPASQTISAGSNATLMWSTTNANSASIDHGVGVAAPTASGSVTVNPTVTTTYTMTAVGLSGNGTCNATVTVTGSAATPVTIVLTSGTSWTVPLDWNNSNNTIEAIGEGANGADEYTTGPDGGEGGGGGAYAKIFSLSLAPGASVPIQIGAGGQGKTTQFRDSSTLVADYGRHGTSYTAGGAGGSAANSVGTIRYSGGAGGAEVNSGGGGGGGAAGPSGSGKNGGLSVGNTGAGGGGSNNGTVGADSTAGSTGGNGVGGTGGGTGCPSDQTLAGGGAGSAGGGGGGACHRTGPGTDGGQGGSSVVWTQTSNNATAGPGGGGGGGNGSNPSYRGNGGAGGFYGGGGGGSGYHGTGGGVGGTGGRGAIIITYTPSSGYTQSAAVCTFIPASQAIPYGTSATLVWTTTNATSLNVDQGVGALTPASNGSTRVSPTSNTIYTGIASGPGGSHTCSAAVNIQGTPYYQGSSSTGLAGPNGFAIAGNYAYVVDFTNNALVTYNISNPANPTMTSSVTTGLSQPWTLAVANGYAYVTNYGNNSIVVMDLSSPGTPVRVNTITANISSPFGATVAGNYLYVTNAGNNSLITYSLATPASPAQTSMVTTTLNAPRGITVAGGYAYVTDFNDSSLVTFSLATPSSPVWTNKVTVDSPGISDPTDVKVANGYAYVSNYWSSSLSVLSLATPSTPTLVTNIRTNVYHPGGIAIANGFLYFAAGNNLLLTYSLATPAAPLQIGSLTMSSTGLGGIVSANNALYGLGSSIITFGIY